MKTQFDIEKVLKAGELQNELEYERALISDRKLRVLAKENSKYKVIRKKLRVLIETYENKNWSNNSIITSEKIRESDIAELIAEKERQFIQNRKRLIREKLKTLNLTQQNLGVILGHQSKSYMSELMNGVSPFSMKDLIVIHRILKIELIGLVPTILPHSARIEILSSIKQLDIPKIKLSKDDFSLV